MGADEKKIQFFKNKISTRLEELHPYMSDVKYKLYQTMIDDCSSYDEIREMAELDLQFNMIRYVKDLENQLKLNDTNIEELEAVTNKNKRAARMVVISPKEKKVETPVVSDDDLATLGEDIEDEEVLASAANLLFMRMQNTPPEDLYNDPNDFEEEVSENEIDNIDMGDLFEDTDEINESDDEFDLSDMDNDIEDETINEDDNDIEDTDTDKLDIKEYQNLNDEDDEIIDFGTYDNNQYTKNTDESTDEFDIDDNDLFGDDDSDYDEVGNSDIESDEFDIDDDDLFGDDDNEEDSDNTDDFDIDDDELFGDDGSEDDSDLDSSEQTDDFDIDDDELFGDAEDEIEEDISEEDSNSNNTDDFDIDDNELFGDADNEEDEDLFDDTDDSDEIDNIDDIDTDELFGDDDSDDEDDNDDPFDIDESEFAPEEPEDDIDDFFSELNKSNKNNSNTNKPVKREINTQKIFINGSKRGEQTQKMFTMINNIMGGTSKFMRKASSNVKKVATSKISKINNSAYFDIERNR